MLISFFRNELFFFLQDLIAWLVILLCCGTSVVEVRRAMKTASGRESALLGGSMNVLLLAPLLSVAPKKPSQLFPGPILSVDMQSKLVYSELYGLHEYSSLGFPFLASLVSIFQSLFLFFQYPTLFSLPWNYAF